MQRLSPCKMCHIPLRGTEPYVEPASYTYSLIYVLPSYPVGTGSSLPGCESDGSCLSTAEEEYELSFMPRLPLWYA
jgi:hypothetical protein